MDLIPTALYTQVFFLWPSGAMIAFGPVACPFIPFSGLFLAALFCFRIASSSSLSWLLGGIVNPSSDLVMIKLVGNSSSICSHMYCV